MLLERIHVDLFDGDLQRVIAILPRAALRLPDPLPVGRLIHRAAKAITFHKRLHQGDRVSVLVLPVRRKPPQHAPQDLTPQVRNTHPGQNEKFMIVGDAGQLRAPFFLAPANILIALPALPGRRTKQQARQQPPPVLANGILQVLSYCAAGAKIVKLRQRGGQLLPLGLRTADFLYFNRAQFCESTAVGCLIPHASREHARAHTVGRYLTPRGKGNQAPLMQFQQQRPCRHVLPQPSPITPIPLLTQRLGQSPPAPGRMSRQQLADLLQVALCYLSALHQQRVVHQGSMPEGKSGVQRKSKRRGTVESSLRPVPLGAGCPFPAMDQQVQFFGTQTAARTFPSGPAEGAFFQTLLRALEEKTFLPFGSDREVRSDFQLIAGTNRDLLVAVRKGRFREDLLARINLWPFTLPGLRSRPEDIEPNIQFELDQYAERSGRRITFSKEAKELFHDYALSGAAVWLGNFRDLNAAI